MAKTQALVVLDLETDGLPDGNDFSVVNILEIGFVVTTLALEPVAGYEEVIKMTRPAAERVAKNSYVKEMHTKNGLLNDSIKKATHTLADAEREAIETLHETGLDKGSFLMTGSGVTAFDFPLIKEKMPELAEWFQYFTVDIGGVRRMLSILSGNREFFPKHLDSYGDMKEHRALADAQAHLREMQGARKWLLELP